MQIILVSTIVLSPYESCYSLKHLSSPLHATPSPPRLGQIHPRNAEQLSNCNLSV